MYFVSRETDLYGRIFSEGSRDLQGLLRVKQIVRPDSEATSAIHDTNLSWWTGKCGLHRTLTQMWASLSQDEAHSAFPEAHHTCESSRPQHSTAQAGAWPHPWRFPSHFLQDPCYCLPTSLVPPWGTCPSSPLTWCCRNIELLCAPLTHLLSCLCSPVWKAPPPPVTAWPSPNPSTEVTCSRKPSQSCRSLFTPVLRLPAATVNHFHPPATWTVSIVQLCVPACLHQPDCKFHKHRFWFTFLSIYPSPFQSGSQMLLIWILETFYGYLPQEKQEKERTQASWLGGQTPGLLPCKMETGVKKSWRTYGDMPCDRDGL